MFFFFLVLCVHYWSRVFDAPEITCASSFCHLQPDVPCPRQNGTHRRVPIMHCSSFGAWLEMDTSPLFFWGLKCQRFHSTSRGVTDCFIYESQNWESKVKLRFSEVPPIYLWQCINSLTIPTAVYMCAFQKLLLQSHGERELESLSFYVDSPNVGHMGAKMWTS